MRVLYSYLCGERLRGRHRGLAASVQVNAHLGLSGNSRPYNVNHRQTGDAHHLRRLQGWNNEEEWKPKNNVGGRGGGLILNSIQLNLHVTCPPSLRWLE